MMDDEQLAMEFACAIEHAYKFGGKAVFVGRFDSIDVSFTNDGIINIAYSRNRRRRLGYEITASLWETYRNSGAKALLVDVARYFFSQPA